MPTAYREYETEYDEYEERRPRRRRRRRRRGRGLMVLLLLALAIIAAWRLTDGFAFLRSSSVPMGNVRAVSAADLSALAPLAEAADVGYYPEEADLAELYSLAEDRPEYAEKIAFLIEHVGAYSDTAVRNVLVSPEKIDFVLQYPFTGDNGGGGVSVKKGSVPYLIQYDERWGYHTYGSGGIGYTGCGPTCLSMAVMGLTGDAGATPDLIADYAVASELYVPGVGTGWELMTTGAAHFGVYGEAMDTSEEGMSRELRSGKVLIASVLPGDFTRAGHFIVICGSTLGGYRVYDPNCVERSERAWSYEELAPQIAQLWSMSAA